MLIGRVNLTPKMRLGAVGGRKSTLSILTFGPNVYMCYDYAHLDNLSDISAYRNHNVQECKMQIT